VQLLVTAAVDDEHVRVLPAARASSLLRPHTTDVCRLHGSCHGRENSRLHGLQLKLNQSIRT